MTSPFRTKLKPKQTLIPSRVRPPSPRTHSQVTRLQDHKGNCPPNLSPRTHSRMTRLQDHKGNCPPNRTSPHPLSYSGRNLLSHQRHSILGFLWSPKSSKNSQSTKINLPPLNLEILRRICSETTSNKTNSNNNHQFHKESSSHFT